MMNFDACFGDLESDLNKLERLISKYPNYKWLSLGDFLDRNLQTKEVLDILIEHKAIKGNHEDAFLNNYYYSKDILNFTYYFIIGGDKTILSFLNTQKDKNRFYFYSNYLIELYREVFNNTIDNDIKKTNIYKKDPSIAKGALDFILETKNNIDIKYINFIENSPLFLEDNNYLISHNLLDKKYTSYQEAFSANSNYHWTKDVFLKERNKFQIFGHHNHDQFKYFYNDENTPFAICLDSSKGYKIAIYDFNIKKAFNI
jgi:hypothetical protein